MTRTMLVGTERSLLNQTADLLRAAGGQAMVVADFKRAETELSRFRPNMIVVSLDDPDAAGWNFMFRHGINEKTNVIATTAQGDISQELTVLRLGAQDYIRFPVTPEVLFVRINSRIRQNDKQLDENAEIAIEVKGNRGALTIDKSRFQAFWLGSELSLTRAEFMLLTALARHDGLVKSREQLIDCIYDQNMHHGVNDRNVDSHIKRVRKKVRDVDPIFDGIETIYGLGYKLSIDRTRRTKQTALTYQRDSYSDRRADERVPRLVSVQQSTPQSAVS